jgi:GST-like protein
MITLYSKATSNGRKASIMLEEAGLSYRARPMDLTAKEQKQPWFLAINPQGRVPVIVDDDGPEGQPVTVFESGVILIYLAEKAGKFLPTASRPRAEVMKWLMFTSTHLTFTAMQVHWQVRQREEGAAHDLLRVWQQENERVYEVYELGLADGRRFLAGDDYSIADIAAYPWIYRWKMQEVALHSMPGLKAWFERVGARDAVKRGLAVPPRGDGM